ncbi:MAG: tRNA (adenosine(37)-N6)-threonylcarbamoyltransferase complex ATPase subunit type 1 TsaE [Ruminococcaceae bacterium]|nr:tRNA (adenosine(37)-N6)-threonylcarbamoyltransferase complex ATPase subunit type 1 TsaE [Oscillospiraceae bacterium]
METIVNVESAEETEAVGRALAALLEKNGIGRAFIAMRGEMGVGKTAFTRGFASHFDIRTVKSPTYTILNEYIGRCRIHHFDFYRITDGDDLYSIGYDDLIEQDGYSIGEWSENIEDFLPADAITVAISRVTSEDSGSCLRKISINSPINLNGELLLK